MKGFHFFLLNVCKFLSCVDIDVGSLGKGALANGYGSSLGLAREKQIEKSYFNKGVF